LGERKIIIKELSWMNVAIKIKRLKKTQAEAESARG